MDSIKSFRDGLRPLPRLKPSEWAEQYRVLSSEASAEPGKWKNSRTPYLRQIMDDFSPYSPVQTVVIMKGSQVGLTEAGFNVIGFMIDTSPRSIMYLMPTDTTAKRNSTIRFDPMVKASESLSAKVRTNAAKDKSNSMQQKSFPGGVLFFAGANSPSQLRSLPLAAVFLDELDAMPNDVGGEGDPVALAEARTRTFPNRKVAIISTPTKEGASKIAREYENTDQRMFFVPCVECGFMQVLDFDNLKWTNRNDVKYECQGCGHMIPERNKPRMLKLGEWRSTKPENTNPIRVGYHINALYSPYGWFSWGDIVEKYEKINGDPTQQQVFDNTILGIVYTEKGDKPEWEKLYNRRENYPTYRPPKPVCLLTAGVDVQKDRLEIEIVGWCPDLQSYSIDYRVLMGDTSVIGAGSPWAELSKIVNEQFEREDGRILSISKMAIDSGFNTSEVYQFCIGQDANKVVAVKGRESLNMAVSSPRPVNFSVKGKPIKFNALWGVGTSFLKSEIYGKLNMNLNDDGGFPAWYCHFPTAYDAHYFKMLTAEQQQRRFVKGFAVYEWVKTFTRNEALDCRVYARAALSMMGAERWKLEQWQIFERQSPIRNDPKPYTQKKSSFWD